ESIRLSDTPFRNYVVLEWPKVGREIMGGGKHDDQVNIAWTWLGCDKAPVYYQLYDESGLLCFLDEGLKPIEEAKSTLVPLKSTEAVPDLVDSVVMNNRGQ